jgi:hypothetical protein
MRHSEMFKREKPGSNPAWLKRLREVNMLATAMGKPAPFGGTPKLASNGAASSETYPSGATVVFTGVTGNGTVTLDWEE